MKNKRLEKLARLQLRTHRLNPWPLNQVGLYTHHEFDDSNKLFWYTDFGFVMNGRRIMVWLEHPRARYKEEIHQRAIVASGDTPLGDWLDQITQPVHKRVGRSRKKVIAHRTAGMPTEWREYSDRVRKNEEDLEQIGIDFEAKASYCCKRLPWAMGVDLNIPHPLRTEADLVEIKRLVIRLMHGETTIAREFPDYSYGRENWLAESALRDGATDESEVHALRGIAGPVSKIITIEEMNAVAEKAALAAYLKSES